MACKGGGTYLDQIEIKGGVAGADITNLSLLEEDQVTLKEELVLLDFGATTVGRRL